MLYLLEHVGIALLWAIYFVCWAGAGALVRTAIREMSDSVGMGLLYLVLGLGLASGLVGAGYYALSPPDPVLTLVKANWACTASHPEQETAYIQSGNIMLPVTSTTNVCDRYERRIG